MSENAKRKKRRRRSLSAERQVSGRQGRNDLAKNAEEVPPVKGIEPIKVAGLSAKDAADKIAGDWDCRSRSSKPNVKITTPNVLAVFPVWAAGAFSGAMLNLHLSRIPHDEKKVVGRPADKLEGIRPDGDHGIPNAVGLDPAGQGNAHARRLGAAIGAGIQQAMQMVGGQGTGFISGEWRGVHGKPRLQMYASIALLILASFIMAYSKNLIKGIGSRNTSFTLYQE